MTNKPKISNIGELITLDEAAALTGLSVWTWRKYVSMRAITSYKVGGRRLLARADVSHLCKQRRFPADPKIQSIVFGKEKGAGHGGGEK